MRGLAQRMAGNEEQRRALRIHNRRYRLTESDRRKLTKALATIETFAEPITLALRVAVERQPLEPYPSIRAALRVLISGPDGEFR